LGEYLLLERIGSGGMGEVFRAEHRTMNRHVAVKILSRKIADNQQLLERFFQEIRAVAKLMHPNIVTAFDAGSQAGIHYLVMELVEGENLAHRVSRLGPFSTADAVQVLYQAASALAYAHQLGIVHRDIKPSNLMISQDGKLKILDFGLAMFAKTAEASQTSGKRMFMGTPEYMSPEQVEKPDAVDGRSDLYSLGATLFYLLAGRPMFTGEQMQVALAQLRQKPPALYELRGDIDLRMDTIFQRLVAKDPAARFSSGGDLLHSMQQLHLIAATGQTSLAASASGSSLGGALSRLAGEHTTSISSLSTLAARVQPVAIDLGMLASTIAYCDARGVPHVAEVAPGAGQHLRNMLWSDGDQIKVGSDAAEMRQTQPNRIFHSLQRWIGAKEITRTLGNRMATPEVLIAAILQRLMMSVKGELPGASHAVVTVPSSYDQMHRRAIQTACRIAGIELLQLLDKPLAAALAWLDVQTKLNTNAPQKPHLMLVLHLGGSGLEASVVRCDGNSVQSLGNCGDWQLGIPRWQSALANHFSQQLTELTGKQIREDVVAATRLQRTIELSVERLTRAAKVEIRFEWLGKSIDQTVTQAGFLSLAPLLQESITKVVAGACKHAKVEIAQLEEVLLCGSMLRMRPLQDFVRRMIPQAPLPNLLEKADLARGAALQAHYLGALSPNDQLPHAVACTSYNFGLLAADPTTGKGSPRVLIEAGAPLPAVISKNLRGEVLAGGHTLQLIESTRLGEATWHRLGAVKPEEAFPKRAAEDPLQLRLTADDSGLFQAELLWPAGNRQLLIKTSDATPEDTEVALWKRWLETAMLCSS
jgi:hypothetical protein